MTRNVLGFVVSCVLAGFGAVPMAGARDQEASARALFQAGKYQEAVEAVNAQGEHPAPNDVYLAAQSLSRMDRRDEARDTYRRLDTGNEEDPWTFISRSAVAVLEGNPDAALEAADRAVAVGPEHFHAHYQLGVAKSLREDFTGAAAAFERATELDGGDAYAHYNAGIAYNKARRVDRMARHFQAFVNLAPNAPEVPQVQTLLRALR